jgi:hypothetical protein
MNVEQEVSPDRKGLVFVTDRIEIFLTTGERGRRTQLSIRMNTWKYLN